MLEIKVYRNDSLFRKYIDKIARRIKKSIHTFIFGR